MNPWKSHHRSGITLLEVLISLGILSVGLASVVALVPAGGDQAKKALIDDRRGALAANAFADVINRRVLDPTTWSPAQPAAANYRVLFDVPPAVSRARLEGLKAPDRFEREQQDFFERVRQGYLDLARAEPERFVVLDASQPMDAVTAALLRVVEARLG